jgi:hypothetical protein
MKKYVVFVAFIFSLLLFVPLTTYASQGEQLIIINKKTNRLAFFDNGKLVKIFPVGTGRTRDLTPEGTFNIVNKIKNRPYYKKNIPGGDPRNPLGDRWLGLDALGTYGTTYGIHGTNNESSIGKYVSSGCVRMHNKDVRWLFDQVKVKTTVIITYTSDSFEKIALNSGYPISEEQILIASATEQGKILQQKLAQYQAAINSGDIVKINRLYDDFRKTLRNTELKIGKVPGESNRKALGQKYITPAKVAVERTIYEISQYRLLGKIEAQIRSNQMNLAEANMAKLERLKVRAVEIKKVGNYSALPITISRTLLAREAALEGELLKKAVTEYNAAINSGSIANVNNLYEKLSSKIKKTEKKIGLVYGSDQRKKLLSSYVTPAKIAKERTIYEVSQYRLMQTIDKLITENKLLEAKAELSKLNRLQQRASEIKQRGGYENLSAKIYTELAEFQKSLEKKLEELK